MSSKIFGLRTRDLALSPNKVKEWENEFLDDFEVS
jgi:hypothetical protein